MEDELTSEQIHECFREFESGCKEIAHRVCGCCYSTGLSIKLIVSGQNKGLCTRCAALKDRKYYLKRRALPVWRDGKKTMFTVPPQLACLTHAEKMLIQRISPFVPLHHIKQGVMGLSGHVCAFEQDVVEFVNRLPRSIQDVTVLKVLKTVRSEVGSSKGAKVERFRVRKKEVGEALVFLKRYNTEYHDIEIDMDRLNWITGEEGDLEGHLLGSEDDTPAEDANVTNSDMGPAPNVTMDCAAPGDDNERVFGFLDVGGKAPLSERDTAINNSLQASVKRCTNKKDITVDWPAIETDPVSEFGDDKIFALAFPWLFPGGEGDVKDYPKRNPAEWGKMLLFYKDGRFARDKIFSFFAMNYIIRMRNSSSGKWFVDKFQRNCPESLEELKESMDKGDTSFVNSLTYYNKCVKGSTAYWYQKRSELYTWINHHVEKGHGAPSFFITLSCAEHFWPDIFKLIKERMKIAGEDPECCYAGSPKLSKLLNEYSIVVQEYFQKRVELWLNTVGKKVFGIEHYWVRYEFAPGRGQIHAHLLAIAGKSEIHRLCHELLQGENGEERRSEVVGEWAGQRFGLTASVDAGFDELDVDKANTPNTIRFSDVPATEHDIKDDVQRLMYYVQKHDCSGFCMRKTNDKW